MAMLANQNLFPSVPADLSTIVKPEELIDIVEMTPLTLQDRRIYNLLIGNAWNHITEQTKHTISRLQLTQHIDSNNQDIKASFRRLMSAIVVIKIRNNRNGNPATRQIQLLGTNEVEENGGVMEYSFPAELVKIIKNTQIFARLHTKVMFQLSSKYSLALYEFLQKRKNLQYIDHELLSVEEARALLGVGSSKLKSFGHFNDKALKPAVREVSFLTEYQIDAEPIRTGRAVTHIRFSWHKKVDIGAQISAVEELERSKTGRKVRMTTETDSHISITSSQKSDSSYSTTNQSSFLPPIDMEKLDLYLSSTAIETASSDILNSGKDMNVYELESQFKESIQAGKFNPDNVNGAFINFVRKKIAAQA